MLTFSPNKIANSQTLQTKQNVSIPKQTHNKNSYISSSNAYYGLVSFKGDTKITRPAFRTSDKIKFDNLYDKYKKSLQEISEEDIKNVVDDLEKTTQYSRYEILKSMQQATQFANYDSISLIEDSLNKNDTRTVTNNINFFKNSFGLNASLQYFFNQKNLGIAAGNHTCIFLDQNKLEFLEEMNKKRDGIIEENAKAYNTNFFILSGFDKGINLFNRNKDLKETTKYFLEHPDYDNEYIERAHKMGVEPIVIKNTKEPTIKNIYNQLKPLQISKEELEAVIDSAVIQSVNKHLRSDSKGVLVEYLNNEMDIYTPENISKNCKKLYEKISNIVTAQGKTMDDVYYFIPKIYKSYAPINYQYQLTNNIPKEKFITNSPYSTIKDLKNKYIVILDDCSISGSSMVEAGEMATKILGNDTNIIYAPIKITNTAENEIKNNINQKHRENKDNIVAINYFKNINYGDVLSPVKQHLLYMCLGEDGFENCNSCVSFPYMTPDNNSEFGCSVALFHLPSFRNNQEKISTGLYYNFATKVTKKIKDTAILAINLLNEGND